MQHGPLGIIGAPDIRTAANSRDTVYLSPAATAKCSGVEPRESAALMSIPGTTNRAAANSERKYFSARWSGVWRIRLTEE